VQEQDSVADVQVSLFAPPLVSILWMAILSLCEANIINRAVELECWGHYLDVPYQRLDQRPIDCEVLDLP
jgi:hypothetical protein